MEPIKQFYVTFGQKSPFRNSYVLIHVHGVKSDDEAHGKARDEAFRALGNEWSNIYSEANFTEHISLFPGGKVGETIDL